MSGTLIGIGALVALLAWFLGFGNHKPIVHPEDDIDSPIEMDELEIAEAELRADPTARSIGEALGPDGEDDDWGPGAPGSGSALPGIL
jgi:hypothetical protein